MTNVNPPIEEDVLYEFLRACTFELGSTSRRMRCMCDSPQIITQDTPLLTFPGGEFGFLLGLSLTSSLYGFEVDILKAVREVHTCCGSNSKKDCHDALKIHLAQCRFIYQVMTHPESFELNQGQLSQLSQTIFKDDHILTSRKSSPKQFIQAIILWESKQGLKSHYRFDTDGGAFELRVEVIHKVLLNDFLRSISKALVAKKIVKLHKGLDEEYLAEVLSETCETLMLSYLFREYPTIPIYAIRSEPDSEIKITLLS